MTHRELSTVILTLTGTAALMSLMLWMTAYLAGGVMLLLAAPAWLILLTAGKRKMHNLRSLTEYGIFTGLLAAQLGLLVAILMRVFSGLLRPLPGLA